MPIKIIRIHPQVELTPAATDERAVAAHKEIDVFYWVNDQNQATGNSAREVLYNWIVNQKGKAYLINNAKETIYLYGASTPSGDHYVRAAKDGAWSNDLFDLVPKTPASPTPPAA